MSHVLFWQSRKWFTRNNRSGCESQQVDSYNRATDQYHQIALAYETVDDIIDNGTKYLVSQL